MSASIIIIYQQSVFSNETRFSSFDISKLILYMMVSVIKGIVARKFSIADLLSVSHHIQTLSVVSWRGARPDARMHPLRGRRVLHPPPPPVGMGGESLLLLSSPVKETVQ